LRAGEVKKKLGGWEEKLSKKSDKRMENRG
jgi:hypothetical protein